MEKSEDDIEEVEKGVYELFKYIFITNCKIDENSMTEEEAKTIEELDSLELLQNLKDLANELLDFKKEHKNSELSELAERAD